MSPLNKAAALASVELLLCVVSAKAQSAADWRVAFNQRLAEIANNDHSQPLAPGEAYGAWLRATSLDLDDAATAEAVFSLWLSDNPNIAEVVWWRRTDRATRALLVAFYACTTTKALDGLPPFGVFAGRFREKEAKERQEEVAFVNDHLSAIAAKLTALTAGIERAKELHQTYAWVAKEKVGSPLPK